MDQRVSFDVTDYYPDEDEWIKDLVTLNNDSMSGPSSPIHQIPAMKSPNDATEYVIITLDILGDNVSVHSVEPVQDGRSNVDKNQELMPQRRLEYNSTVSGPSSQIHHNLAIDGINENQELALQRRNACEALKGLKMFISVTDAGWNAVEKRFEKITAETGGLLIRSKFGECVGINSKRFAFELFDTLARRWNVTGEVLDKAQLWDFFEQISDQSFGSRLMIFFEMADEDGDGRLTQDQVKKLIRLIASANNQFTIQKMADEYAALIMEAIDSYHVGYVIMEDLKRLLQDVETLNKMTNTEETKKSIKRCWKVQNMIPCFKKRLLTKKT